jgi:hypothetical protein
MEWESHYCAVRGKSVLAKKSVRFTSLGEQRWFYYRGEDEPHKSREEEAVKIQPRPYNTKAQHPVVMSSRVSSSIRSE